MRLGAIILAGGRSRRMGQPKELLPFAGDTLLGRTCRTLLGCCAPVVVVVRDTAQVLPMLPPEIAVTTDPQPDAGPLAAIAHGLAWLRQHHAFAADDATFVCGCDQPFLTATAVRRLAERLGGGPLLMPRVDGLLQPLGAIYRTAAGDAAVDLLASGIRTPRSLADLAGARILDEAACREIDPALATWVNVNTPEELKTAARRPLPPTVED